MNTNVIVLPLIYDFQSEKESIGLKFMKNASFDFILILFYLAREITEYLKTHQNFFIFLADTLEKLCLAMENIDYVPWDCQER